MVTYSTAQARMSPGNKMEGVWERETRGTTGDIDTALGKALPWAAMLCKYKSQLHEQLSPTARSVSAPSQLCVPHHSFKKSSTTSVAGHCLQRLARLFK